MKGIILAGGSGTRLHPLTSITSKQLLPVYDKPLIYYPLSTLISLGIDEILVISNSNQINLFEQLLGNGKKFGISLSYEVQIMPNGIAEALLIGEKFLGSDNCCLILGDNIFVSNIFQPSLVENFTLGAKVFTSKVKDPERYGVVGFDDAGSVNSIVEKPDQPASNYAITGLYFVDETAPDRAKQVQASKRGEMEITSVLDSYQKEGSLTVEKLGRGFAWLDTGTHNSLLDASNFVKTLTVRQGLQVGSPDEVAYKAQWVTKENLKSNSELFEKNEYGRYLLSLISDT